MSRSSFEFQAPLRLSAHVHTLPADDFVGTDGCACAAIGLARAITSDRGLSAQQKRGHSTISRSSSAGATLAPNGSRAGSTADRGGYAKYCFTRRRQPDGYRDAIRPSCQFGHGGHGPRHPDPAIPQRARRAEHRSGVERGPNRRAGRADLGLHARRQLQSHQSAGRRHRCQRSQHA